MRGRNTPQRLVEDPDIRPDTSASNNAGNEAVSPESPTRRNPPYVAEPFGFSKHAIAVYEQEQGQQQGQPERRWLHRSRRDLPYKQADDGEEQLRTGGDCAREALRETSRRSVEPAAVPAFDPWGAHTKSLHSAFNPILREMGRRLGGIGWRSGRRCRSIRPATLRSLVRGTQQG